MENFDKVVQKISYWNKTPAPTLSSPVWEEDDTVVEGGGKRTNPLDLFRGWRLFKQSMKLSYMLFTTGVLYYGLSMSASNLTGRFYMS